VVTIIDTAGLISVARNKNNLKKLYAKATHLLFYFE
jgi:hypothetical protein